MSSTPREALAQIWDAVGGEAELLDGAEITGGDPFLPSAFPVGAVAAATIAAASLAVGAIEVDTGPARPSVSVDVRSACAAFRSERYLQVLGSTPTELWGELSGVYRSADGWVRLHCNFDHHRTAALAALGLRQDVDRVALQAALATLTAVEVETAITEHGGCATALRTSQTWDAHPHGSVVRDVGLVQLTRFGEASPRPMRAGDRALSGLRVLDLTRVIAGPVCGRFLAAHGAEVLRVSAPHLPTFTELDLDTSIGKRSTLLDLRNETQRGTLAALAREADVFVQGYRPDAIARLGLGAADLAALRPGIVVVNVSAYGQVGPWAERRGFDSLVQIASGISDAETNAGGSMPDGSPRSLPCQALDHATGYLAALGALAARRRQAREGGSWSVDVSLARTSAWIQDLGRVPGGSHIEDPGDDVDDLLEVSTGPNGSVRHVSAIGAVNGRAPRWDRPAPSHGADTATWLDRTE